MLYTLRFFSSKCSLFYNANLFGFCIIHILYKECAKIKRNIFRRQMVKTPLRRVSITVYRAGTKLLGPDSVACVFVFLGTTIICRLYRLTVWRLTTHIWVAPHR